MENLSNESKSNIYELTVEIYSVLKKYGLVDFLVYDMKNRELINVDSLSINGLALQLNIKQKLKVKNVK